MEDHLFLRQWFSLRLGRRVKRKNGWRRFAIQEKVFAFGLERSTPPKKPPEPMTENVVRFTERKLNNHPPLYQYGDANNNNNMNNQARTLNLNLEFGYDLNHGGAIGVGDAINANPFVSCVDENFEYGSGYYEVEKKNEK
ncbi:hypothetical protein AHAS_Ahas16G0228500 [Arachis hypogaea]